MRSIVSAKYVAPLKVELHFNDDTVKTIDVGAFIKKHPHPQYNSYLNESKFKKFKIEFGNIVWGKNWDLIFPIDKLYTGVYWTTWEDMEARLRKKYPEWN